MSKMTQVSWRDVFQGKHNKVALPLTYFCKINSSELFQ